jgi:hypothetical protein
MVATLAVVMTLPVISVIVWRFWVTGPQRKPSNGVNAIDTVDRAETYLRRVVAFTGATRLGAYYVLDVGKTRFEVYDSYVCRTPSVTDLTATTHEGTCFYLSKQYMPAAEKIATALLQLKNNPRLFDKWAGQSGVFKADGELFKPCHSN